METSSSRARVHVLPDGSTRRITDSMVTVSLSDVQSNPDHSNPLSPSYSPALIDPVSPSDAPPEVAYSNNISPAMDAADRIDPEAERLKGTDASSIRSHSSEGRRERSRDAAVWEELDKTEEQEPRDQTSDESTALLLARLEKENNAIATDPKAGLSGATHAQRQARTHSLHQIKQLMSDPRSTLRYSQLPTPPMTELEFWAALVSNYPQTAQRLPTLTSNKMRGGVPPPLRGVVWPSVAGARDTHLLSEFERLCGESSPYEGLIGKDIGRSFPNVDMFRDPRGEGQEMLGRVLKCFSLYDKQIGYCQGLGFVVGPLLMHMTDAEAFCVLVRLMDHYGLRTCYLPDLSGLHLRVYQFQNLLARHRPALFSHLESLHVEPVYVSQWFLSFFAITCPLPMLLRIYDVIFLEGASETLMRVALSLMRRNEKRILAFTEFEDVMQFLLSRSMWDTYALHADDLVDDFVSLTSLVTMESLQALEASYSESQGVSTGMSFPQMQAAASRFLGRLWAGSTYSMKPLSVNQGSSPANTIHRSTSKQSMTSTLNSVESASDASTALTEVSNSGDSKKPRPKSSVPQKDRDLHTQIEDLLMALGDLQRQQVDLTRELQREREEREEDQEVAKSMLEHIKATSSTTTMEEPNDDENANSVDEIIAKAEARFTGSASRQISITQTKQQLLDDANRWKEMHELEAGRCLNLNRRIDEQELENSKLREELREARTRIQDGYHDKQRLGKTILELRAGTHHYHNPRRGGDNNNNNNSNPRSPETHVRSPTITTGNGGTGDSPSTGSGSGLRQLRLVRINTSPQTQTTTSASPSSPSPAPTPASATAPTPTFNKRSSSLGLQSVLATQNNKPAPEEALLLELVHAKTAEAVAQQELEEAREALRKFTGGSGSRNSFTSVNLMGGGANGGISGEAKTPRTATEPVKRNNRNSGQFSGGFFSGWGRRAASGSTTPNE